jgi:arginyl-tRNA synthetase
MMDAILIFSRKKERFGASGASKTLDTLNVHHDVFFNEEGLYSDGKIATAPELREKGFPTKRMMQSG